MQQDGTYDAMNTASYVIFLCLFASVPVAVGAAEEILCSRAILETPWIAKSSASSKLVTNRLCRYPLADGVQPTCKNENEVAPIITYVMLYYKDSIFLDEQKKKLVQLAFADSTNVPVLNN